MSTSMSELTGRIVLAQEGRFLLEDELGRKRLFIVSNMSSLDSGQLQELMQTGVNLKVRYSEPEHLVASVAHSIEIAGQNNWRWGLRRTIRRFLADWSLPPQLTGEIARATAAMSATSRQLRPRLVDADQVGTSICCYCAVGCAQLVCQEWQGHSCRRRSAQSDQ